MTSKSAPCPCGSGKKYKACCLPKELAKRQKMQRRVGGLVAIVLLVGVAIVAGVSFRKTNQETQGLDHLAKCLTKKGWKMYGAWWCPHCEEQKKIFGSSFHYIHYVECYKAGSRQEQTPACIREKIRSYPTWEDPKGEKYQSARLPEQLADLSGCPYNP